jgi:hypothetical protein
MWMEALNRRRVDCSLWMGSNWSKGGIVCIMARHEKMGGTVCMGPEFNLYQSMLAKSQSVDAC